MNQPAPDHQDGVAAAGLADVRDLDTAAVLAQVVAERAAADRSEARLLALAVHYVDLHPVTDRHPAATHQHNGDPVLSLVGRRMDARHPLGDGDDIALAGDGTPGIAAYAVEQLGAVLHTPYASALALVADAVELCYRLPRLWTLVQDGWLPAWRARQVARLTPGLTAPVLRIVDAQVELLVTRRRVPTLASIRDLIHEAQLRFDPDRDRAVEEAALQDTGVWFDHGTSTAASSVTTMTARLDSWDALDLDASLDDLAQHIGRLGDARSRDQRRATALGMLAHPQRALDLGASESTAGDSAPPAAELPPAAPVTPGSRINLFVHASLTDLARTAGGPNVLVTAPGNSALVESLGPLSLDLLRDWLTRAQRVTVRPVLDPSDPDTDATRPVDRHDPPAAMRELVIQRDGTCVFPGCATDARSCDLDHVEPYLDPSDGGPPGQTHPGNLACTCRRHHRLKTHAGWSYARLPDGSYRWTSPSGQVFNSAPLPRRATITGAGGAPGAVA